MKYRGKMTLSLNLFSSIGRIIALIYAKFLLCKGRESEWRTYVISNLFFSLFTPILVLFVVRESPRYLLSKKKYDEAFYEFDMIGKINNPTSYTPLSIIEKEHLI